MKIFSKDALAERKRELSANADEWLTAYLKGAYVPSGEDFRRLKRHVSGRRKIYEQKYGPIRHRVFAHKATTEDSDVAALFANTNIKELQQLLVFLRRLHEALWHLFFNGAKLALRPARYSLNQMLRLPSPSPEQTQVQERLAHETRGLLRSLAEAPDTSVERTSSGRLRPPRAAAHVER